MSAIKPITLADGQATPANHIFSPRRPQIGDDFAQWQNAEGDTLVGARQLSLRVRKNSSGYIIEGQVKDPIKALIPSNCCAPTNVPQVAYTNIFDFKFRIPLSATLANRKDVLAYAKNFLANTAVTDSVENVEVTW